MSLGLEGMKQTWLSSPHGAKGGWEPTVRILVLTLGNIKATRHGAFICPSVLEGAVGFTCGPQGQRKWS